MAYKKILGLAVVVLVGLTVSCPEKTTGIKGQLILQTGQTGDVRNCRVQLFVSSDLTGNPVKEVASTATGVDQTKSDFLFEDVLPQYYYLLAWKDLNGSGKIDHLDIVGVNGGAYRPGYGGTQVTVTDGKITDVGQVVMNIYKQLILSVTASLGPNNLTRFTYSFNDDCDVTGFRVSDLQGNYADDPAQAGHKTANTQYSSDNWNTNGNPLSGTFIVALSGSYNGAAFVLADTLNI